MKIAPLVQDVPLNDFEGKTDNSRPPDAGIRAIADIMKDGMEKFGRLMEAAGRGGLNLVVNGSNATAPRAPERISGFNSNELAAIGALGGLAAKSAGAEKEQPKVDTPASNPPPNPSAPEPQADVKPSNNVPAPTGNSEKAEPADKKVKAPASPSPKPGRTKKDGTRPAPADAKNSGDQDKPTKEDKSVAQKKPEDAKTSGDGWDMAAFDLNGDGNIDEMEALAMWPF